MRKEKNTGFQDKSVYDLSLHTIRDFLDISQFNIFSSSSLANNHVNIHAGIIGTSHFIHFHGKRAHFYEVIACDDVISPKPHTQKQLKDMENEELSVRNPHYTYRFKAKILNAELWKKKHEAFEKETLFSEKSTMSLKLDYTFPSKTQKGARTIIMIQIIRERAMIKTLHEYPDENMAAYTSSVFRF